MAKIKKPELLAPAGSADAFRAAIENGADAIYLGTQEFSARHYAENFTMDQLPDLVAQAHKRAVKIYLTVNTILNDREINQYPSYLYKAAQAGVDALIVQDPGVVFITRQMLPEMPLHASTQMTVHNSVGVNTLEQMGFSRIVLARETSLADIKTISQNTSLELEMFGHGALCVSYSGICYLSSMIGGRSGNRGRCAQPCRLPYHLHENNTQTAKNNKGQEYLLSTKDLRMIEHLPAIVDANIASIKLEGRMKRPEYVAVITDLYRKAIDSYFKNPSEFFIDPQMLRELDQTFSRGSSAGHYLGRLNKESMTFSRPNHAGTLLGKVVAFKKGQAFIKVTESVAKGDGYLIQTAEGEISGTFRELSETKTEMTFAVPGKTIAVLIKGKAKPGDLVYKTRDSQLNRKARDTFSSEKVTNKKEIQADIIIKAGEPVYYKVTTSDGFTVSGKGTVLVQEAINRPLTLEVLTEQLSRLGNTGFVLQELKADIQGAVMVPLKELNALRKEFVERLEEQRKKTFQKIDLPDFASFLNKKPVIVSQPPKDQTKKLAVAVRTIAALEAAVSQGADIIYLYLNSYRPDPLITVEKIAKAADFCDQKASLVFVLPAIIKEAQVVHYTEIINKIKDFGYGQIALATIGQVGLIAQNNNNLIHSTEYTFNIFNSYAVEYIKKQKVERCTLSPEMSLDQIKNISSSDVEKEIIIQGNFPLLTTEYCVTSAVSGCHTPDCTMDKDNLHEQGWYLKDRKRYRLPWYADYDCRSYLYNAKELSVYRDLDQVMQSPVNILRIEAGIDTPERIAIKTKLYRDQIDLWNSTGRVSITQKNIEKMSSLAEQGQTAGHFFRGVE